MAKKMAAAKADPIQKWRDALAAWRKTLRVITRIDGTSYIDHGLPEVSKGKPHARADLPPCYMAALSLIAASESLQPLLLAAHVDGVPMRGLVRDLRASPSWPTVAHFTKARECELFVGELADRLAVKRREPAELDDTAANVLSVLRKDGPALPMARIIRLCRLSRSTALRACNRLRTRGLAASLRRGTWSIVARAKKP